MDQQHQKLQKLQELAGRPSLLLILENNKYGIITKVPVEGNTGGVNETSLPVEITYYDKDANPLDLPKTRLKSDPHLFLNACYPGRIYPTKEWEELIEGAKILDPKVEIKRTGKQLFLVTKWNKGRQEHRFDKNGRKVYEVNSDGFGWGSSRHSIYQFDDSGRLTLFDWRVTEGPYPEYSREKAEYRKRVAYEYEGDSLKYREDYQIGQDLGRERGGENTRV